MNLRSRDNVRAVVGVAVSIFAHAALLLPWFVATLQSRGAGQDSIEAALAAELQEELMLGLEESEASTIAWIGYDQYEEHLAKLSEIDQAAMTDAPPSGALPMQAAPPQTNVEIAQSAPSVQRAPSELPIDVPPPPALLFEPAPLVAAPDQPLVLLPERIAETDTESPSDRDAVKSASAPPGDDSVAPQPAIEPVPPARVAADGEHTDAQDAPAGQPVPPSDARGDVTDLESDPTSIIDVPPDYWKNGKPLAAQGMELKPQRPEFTTLVMVTAAPRNPLCAMIFDHRGVVVAATIVRSSGDSRVDKAILDSLFGWRARGKPIDALKGTENTMTVPMRIILVEGRDG